MKERLTKRREARAKKGNKPQADEFYCYDSAGVKVGGKYDASGQFVVAPAFRGSAKVDSQGFLLAAGG